MVTADPMQIPSSWWVSVSLGTWVLGIQPQMRIWLATSPGGFIHQWSWSRNKKIFRPKFIWNSHFLESHCSESLWNTSVSGGFPTLLMEHLRFWRVSNTSYGTPPFLEGFQHFLSVASLASSLNHCHPEWKPDCLDVGHPPSRLWPSMHGTFDQRLPPTHQHCTRTPENQHGSTANRQSKNSAHPFELMTFWKFMEVLQDGATAVAKQQTKPFTFSHVELSRADCKAGWTEIHVAIAAGDLVSLQLGWDNLKRLMRRWMEELFEELRSLRVTGAHKNYSRMVTILQIWLKRAFCPFA